MPEITSPPQSDGVQPDRVADDPVTARVRDAGSGLTALLAEAEAARHQRAESAQEEAQDGGTAVCAWNHFENIPTFYNWNNRPR
ncbi:multiple cyclophane-containing RiPP AmcA [Actinoplanes sp. NPDC051470]|uniref:multiple cyclophane-containing RiPP AmcA n=1 Tax=unclassified Actinoplanes TaxID=2626549 RepID=UPI003425EA2E